MPSEPENEPDLIRGFLVEYDRCLTSESGLTWEQWMDTDGWKERNVQYARTALSESQP